MMSIELLEDRIRELEIQVYGNEMITQSNDNLPEISIVDNLLHVNTLVSSALSGRKEIHATLKRLPELNKYLECAMEESDMPFDVKLQFLLTFESEIRRNHDLLVKVEELTSALETDKIRDVPELMPKLNKLSVAYRKVYEDSEAFARSMYDIFSKYNDVISNISKTLIALDNMITNAEIAAMPKKLD